MLFDTLALISLIVVITLLRRLENVYPSLMACLIRWKESVNLSMSVKLSRDRDLMAAALVIPFCLCAYRFRLYTPAFMDGFNENIGLCITVGIFIAYILLRTVLTAVARPKRMKAAAYNTSSAATRTYFAILTLLLLATGGIMSFLDINPEIIRSAMIWISAVIYGLLLLRRIQIFASSYNFITVFLYLCALEILPTGILVISAMIL